MVQPLNVLILENYPIIIEAYKMALNQIASGNNKFKFNVDIAHDYIAADIKINETLDETPYDLVLLDYNLFSTNRPGIISGIDLGIKIKQLNPRTKLIILTSEDDDRKLYNNFKMLKPHGFLIKNDFLYEDLIQALTKVIHGSHYYSNIVSSILRNHKSNKIVLDIVENNTFNDLLSEVEIKLL
ncbi:response regulator [Snuella sedimenti]|uniref:Response regulator transcription factor n=1 Tax=Snuella sedimenti TaxID=2798802 RepID=A0A8J7IGW1_9FLAO|nr:response regulator transcription factor [Snuella sedimenti]MBJ6367291.1 response regulator transcription factor [Snuella sedimenti]